MEAPLHPEEELFLSTLDDLDNKVRRGDTYSLLQVAGLLRPLVLDERLLVDIVKRRYKFKVRVEVLDFRIALEGYDEVLPLHGVVYPGLRGCTY